MGKRQIILAGVGGQGLVSSGQMYAEAASIYEKLETLMGCAYGSEARGTFTKAEVIIDDKRIYFPEVQKPDIVVALHQIAYNRYVSSLGPETKLIYDSDQVAASDSAAEQVPVPMSSMCEAAGAVGSLNMITLGILSAMDDMVSPEPLEILIDRKFSAKPKVAEKCKKALWAGYKYIKGE